MQEINQKSHNNNTEIHGLKSKPPNKVQVATSKINTLFGYAIPRLRKSTHT